MQVREGEWAEILDVSHYQGKNIDWAKVTADGICGVIAKASQGTSMRDDTLVRNVTEAKKNGLLVGAYHFLNATSPLSAAAEAKWFVDTLKSVGGAEALDFPPVMDFEKSSLSRAAINEAARVFLTAVETLSGVRPMIYTGNNFVANFDAWASAYDLWIARYTDAYLPKTGPWAEWTFWQYTEKGKVSGVYSAGLDVNVFNGTPDELRAKYDKEARKQMEELKKQVEALSSKVNQLANKVEDLTTSIVYLKGELEQKPAAVIPAPKWFIDEFGSADLNGRISEPKGSLEFWRTLAVALRVGK